MHAHTRAQLAASTSPPTIPASPSTRAVVTSASTTTTVSAAAVPPDPSKSPREEVVVASSSNTDKTTIVEANNASSRDGSSSGSSEITNSNNTPGRILAEFNAMNLHIPWSRRTPNASRRGSAATTGGVELSGRGKEKETENEQGQWRRKSEGGPIVLARKWGIVDVAEENGVAEGAGAGFGKKMWYGRGDSAKGKEEDSTGEEHAQTRLRCSCDECEGYRVTKGALARNGLCMAVGRRGTL